MPEMLKMLEAFEYDKLLWFHAQMQASAFNTFQH